MGGNAFKDAQGQVLTTNIARNDVVPTLDHFLQSVLKPLGIPSYEMLGSTGKKSQSGDLDIAIDVGEEDKKAFKTRFVSDAKRLIGGNRVKALGQNIAVMYPILNDPQGGNVQIDLMLSSSPQHTAWMMSGAGDEKVKGVYRNLMLAYIAKQRSLSQQAAGNDIKITIGFPNGLQIKRGKEVVVPRTTDPEQILKLLGLTVSPGEIGSFEELVDHMLTVGKLRALLPGFEEYIGHYVKSDPENAQRAIDYIRRKSGVHESLRYLIQRLING